MAESPAPGRRSRLTGPMSEQGTDQAAPEVQPGLQANAIGFVDSVSIGLNSTSPAYSLAAVLGPIALLVGVSTPGIMLASFVPMLLIASSFFFLNRVDPDCGTTFSWVTKAMGPWLGWIGGWAIAMTGVLVLGSLAEVAVKFTMLTFNLDEAVNNTPLVMALSVLLILVMTYICAVGTQASAKVQNVLTLAQVAAILIFIAIAIYKVLAGQALPGAPAPSLSWLNPFSEGTGALTAGLLLGVFAYWGWESALNLSEETTDSRSTPGRAAITSTFVLLVTYVGTAIAVVMLVGPDYLSQRAGEEELVLADLSLTVLGGWKWIVLVAVATSAIASTQTTIIPASRCALSMARSGAIPAYFGRISPRRRTPNVSTWWVAIIAIAWYVGLRLLSVNAFSDSLTALSLMIAFYYCLTGLACVIFYRKLLLKSVRGFLFIGVGPFLGAVLLGWLFIVAIISMADASATGDSEVLGMSETLFIGIVLFVVGIIFMIASRFGGSRFWSIKPSVVNPALVPIREGGTAS